MYIIYWKWEVWKWIKKLLDYNWNKNQLMDDNDFDVEALDKAKYVIVSPWIKPSHKIYEDYSEKIVSELDIVHKILNENSLLDNFRFFWITWSKWKSTTSWILYNILKDNYSNTFIWWNFSPAISKLVYDIITENNTSEIINIVIETSSFMLYNTNDFRFDYSIWTNIEADHLDRHFDYDDYFKSKKKIIELTKNKTIIWKNIDIKDNLNKLIVLDSIKSYDSKLIWQHNQFNINIAVKLAEEIWINNDSITKTVSRLEWLENTLERVKCIDWISIYNDWKSTTPWALLSALKSFDEKVILIAWWSDKWADYSIIQDEVDRIVNKWFLIWDTASKISEIFKNSNIEYEIEYSLEDAVSKAFNNAKKENIWIILFSPWSASFWMFKDYKDRIKVFLDAISKLNLK